MTAPLYGSNAVVPSSSLSVLRDIVQELLTSPWQTYTPTWTSTGTPPAVGNGSITGRWRQPYSASNLIVVEFNLLGGSTTTAGTGVYFFSLPPIIASATSQLSSRGSGAMLDFGVQEYGIHLKIEGGGTTFRLLRDGGNVSAGSPFTIGVGDTFNGQIMYEPA